MTIEVIYVSCTKNSYISSDTYIVQPLLENERLEIDKARETFIKERINQRDCCFIFTEILLKYGMLVRWQVKKS